MSATLARTPAQRHDLPLLRDRGAVMGIRPAIDARVRPPGRRHGSGGGTGGAAGAVDEILLNGARHSFLPTERKQALEESLRAELAALKETHLPDVDG